MSNVSDFDAAAINALFGSPKLTVGWCIHNLCCLQMASDCQNRPANASCKCEATQVHGVAQECRDHQKTNLLISLVASTRRGGGGGGRYHGVFYLLSLPEGEATQVDGWNVKQRLWRFRFLWLLLSRGAQGTQSHRASRRVCWWTLKIIFTCPLSLWFLLTCKNDCNDQLSQQNFRPRSSPCNV